jgi:hypothetical protein
MTSKTCFIRYIDAAGVEHRTTEPMPIDQLGSIVRSLVEQGSPVESIGVWVDAPLHVFFDHEGDVRDVVLGGEVL